MGGTSEELWNSVLDIEVYGTASSTTEEEVVEEEETEEEVSTTTLDGSVEDILGDFWKITMPYDKDGNDSGTVTDPDDRNRDAAEYYDLSEVSSIYPSNLYASGSEVFFVAHSGGATTSGSIYPRCELRQLDSNGSDDLVSFSSEQYLDVTVRAVQTPIEKP